MAGAQVPGHAGAAQVEVAVLHTQAFGAVGTVFHKEGRRLGGVEQLPFQHHDLDLAGVQVGVGHAFGAGTHTALDGHHVFTADDMGFGMGFGGHFGAEHHLGEAVAVAQVNEDKAAVVAAVLHPAHQAHGLTIIGDGKIIAAMAAPPVAQRLDEAGMFFLDIDDGLFRLNKLAHYHYLFYAMVRLSATSAAGTSRCSPDSMFLTMTVPAASSLLPMMRVKRALDLPA